LERTDSRNFVFFCGTDSTTPPAGRGRVAVGFGGPDARLSPATGAAPAQSRKRRAAQVFRAARRAFQPERGFSEGRSVQRHSAGRTIQPSAQRERGRPAGRARGLVLRPGDTGRGFPSGRPGDNPFLDRRHSAGVFLLNSGTGFFPFARDAFRFFRAAASIPSRTTARRRGFPIAGAARFFPIRPGRRREFGSDPGGPRSSPPGRSRGRSPAAAPVLPSRPDDAGRIADLHRIILGRGGGRPFSGRRYGAGLLPFADASRFHLHSTDDVFLHDYNEAVSLCSPVSILSHGIVIQVTT